MLSWTPIDADYFVDLVQMVRVLFQDHKVMNPVRRGDANERMVRPSDEKFLDNTNFKIGKFKPISTDDGNKDMGGRWLGYRYM